MTFQTTSEYLVESDKTGKQAAHKPDALNKLEE
ncbi:DUF2945 domain-containing protein [Nostoc commune]|nr:DUF2945 domain-containing protein [Nostoc commune]MBG1260927.1 DUF2945 domain-containing protein [Nostoc commune BAE]